MKSLRSWLVGIALGTTLFFGAQMAKSQTLGNPLPRTITYQGLLLDNGVAPPNGTIVQMDFYFSDAVGDALYHQTIKNVVLNDGIFNVLLGDPTTGGFPASMNFNVQYAMTIVVNNTTTLPVQLLWSAPYAINSQLAGGLTVSPVPVNGDLFPMPLNNAGKIDPSMLPAISSSLLANAPITSINGTVLPDASGNVTLVAGTGVTITNGPGNQLTISSSNGGPNNEVIGQSGTSGVGLTVQDSELSGNEALIVKGGIGAGNPTGAADGTGLSPGSPQTFWADQVAVPGVTTTSLQIYNKLVSTSSTIIITPFGLTASVGQIAITAQSAGSFTVTSTGAMGSSSGGSVTGLNYLVINH